ncbi:PRA1 family protein B4-like [Pyrus ussuriensis x Pyrus communis]|uniref:PRA1 family protein B4-like n=1 Tax=Pyrus ussuriensis x Pyrus communis TaxID=2448454 RepID=A0A5N5HQG2_9ROSA|nr:PRA1 family protein B4-like [Pyrus ussuriensis x Pyrus communis]
MDPTEVKKTMRTENTMRLHIVGNIVERFWLGKGGLVKKLRQGWAVMGEAIVAGNKDVVDEGGEGNFYFFSS